MDIRRVLTITSLGHLLNHSLTLIYPVVMIQLATLYPQTSLTTLGLLGTVHYLFYGLGAFPAGWLTDRLGARNILLIYFLGSAAAVAYLVLTTGLINLAVGLALIGLFCALYHPSGLTLISHNSPRISRHLGIHGIAGSLGLTLGPLVGGAVASWFGWRAPFALFGFFAAITGIYLWLSSANDAAHRSPSHPQARRPTLLRPLIYCYVIGIFMGLSHRGTLSFMPLHFSQEFEGILAPSRTNGRQRRYSSEDISVIERIKGLRDAGMSLNEIKERLGNRDEGEYRNSYKIDLLANRVARVVKAEVYNFFESDG